MKIIVFSDSHTNSVYIKKALERHRDADAAVFLGDGLYDFLSLNDSFPLTAFFAVRGNCDIGFSMISDTPVTDELTLEGKKIFFCHGHTYSVKGGCEHLIRAARARGADIAMFGHTHIPMEKYIPEDDQGGALYLVNPGSIGGRGADGAHTYAIVDIRDNGVLISHGRL